MFEYQAVVSRVIDGDTVELDVDCGFRITHRLVGRLEGINAPELRTEAGKAALAALHSLVAGRRLSIVTRKDRTEKYGRYLVTIVLDDGSTANRWMLDNGYAVVYMPA